MDCPRCTILSNALNEFSFSTRDDGGGGGEDGLFSKSEWSMFLRMLWTVITKPDAFTPQRISKVAVVIKVFLQAYKEQTGEDSLLHRIVSESKLKDKSSTNRTIKKFIKEKRVKHDENVLDNTILRRAYLSQLNEMRDTLPSIMDHVGDDDDDDEHTYLTYRETSHAEKMLSLLPPSPSSSPPSPSPVVDPLPSLECRTSSLLLGSLLREESPIPLVSVDDAFIHGVHFKDFTNDYFDDGRKMMMEAGSPSGRRCAVVVTIDPPTNAIDRSCGRSLTKFADDGNVFFEEKLLKSRKCQICKAHFSRVHFFYGNHFCPKCSLFNWKKRCQRVDLKGKVALLTGGRKKIGFEIGLLLLRWGAELHVTTRFPLDASIRYSKEDDFDLWKDRLHVYRLDLRMMNEIESFCSYLKSTLHRLDIVINNAAQTVSRPKGYYQRTIDIEQNAPIHPSIEHVLKGNFNHQKSMIEGGLMGVDVIPSGKSDRSGFYIPRVGMEIASTTSTTTTTTTSASSSISDKLSAKVSNDDEHFVDLKSHNSWTLPLHRIPTFELLEVHSINSIAPFILISRLLPLMRPSLLLETTTTTTTTLEDDGKAKFIINVSAMEGQFYRHKSSNHPHTNMAKASLNMLTRTCAPEYAEKYQIYMNSVDTGWVTDEKPFIQKCTMQEKWTPPLDSKDGAARVLDPIATSINDNEHYFGWFFKDYKKTHW